MDPSRVCVCWPCRAQLGEDFLVDGAAYAVWQCASLLLQDPDAQVNRVAVSLLYDAGDASVSAVDVVGMAREVVAR